jgi:cytochrome c biogenesis protein CcdA
VSVNLKLQSISGGWLSHAGNHSNGYWGDILLGAALGPVFNSCSPTYALIVATILPISFGQGLVALTAYAVGLGSTLLAISLIGQRFIASLGIASNPSGWFRRSLGILFILTGLAVIFGLDKTIQSYVLERGWYDTVADIEHVLQLTQ